MYLENEVSCEAANRLLRMINWRKFTPAQEPLSFSLALGAGGVCTSLCGSDRHGVCYHCWPGTNKLFKLDKRDKRKYLSPRYKQLESPAPAPAPASRPHTTVSPWPLHIGSCATGQWLSFISPFANDHIYPRHNRLVFAFSSVFWRKALLELCGLSKFPIMCCIGWVRWISDMPCITGLWHGISLR